MVSTTLQSYVLYLTYILEGLVVNVTNELTVVIGETVVVVEAARINRALVIGKFH